ncbi:MAG: 16S rRNA (guanine(527)-N(7))-methyltransferase RsmG [Treponema sp.]|jgi:16S rRNA (guanine527-N7)-methyltransferase|nr:16S rRNA (guanine(527)-N(7))-methyltransferase RsmG [Treponema sp.]
MEILEEGLLRLRQGDPHIDRLLAARFDEVLGLLNRYIEEIELFNPAYGLVGAKDRRDLVVKHILDSLCPLGIVFRLLQGGGPVADVGSGAGLPGIPLAIALGDCPFTLIERMGRRAGFLRNTLAVLGLSHVTVEEGEMEKAPAGRFSLITLRAFRPLEPPILKGLFRLLLPGGVLAAYKGRREKLAGELGALPGGWEALPLDVPFLGEERHLLIIRPR